VAHIEERPTDQELAGLHKGIGADKVQEVRMQLWRSRVVSLFQYRMSKAGGAFPSR